MSTEALPATEQQAPKKHASLNIWSWLKFFYAGIYVVVWLAFSIVVFLMQEAVRRLYADFGAPAPFLTQFLFDYGFWVGLITFAGAAVVVGYMVFSARRSFRNQALIDILVIIASAAIAILFCTVGIAATYLPIYQLN